ncbi:hypothetical protein Poly30_11110 [Planctomycetes bacterium Poly30]|uniref:Uncharacterized protein n=1 Tax=Saltatorellus ferox TaxID=2528018 RepID=A0A518ENF4_9BACT|nr:hypothetical protein Poly30_11110 [Planctomycetes bacterium Poly30]
MATNKPAKPPTSATIQSFQSELAYAGNRSALIKRIDKLRRRLEELDLDEADRKLVTIDGRAEKKNFAQRLSTAIAQKTADALRPEFAGISPDAEGRGHESKSAGASGKKKIDVNYSTTTSGLELAVSIKTINFRDEKSGRYTKNTKRVDGELRAEAQDCHKRQPYAVLAAYVFLPVDAASDGKSGPSSLKHSAEVFGARGGRDTTKNSSSLFELVYIGLYDDQGNVDFFVADKQVPDRGVPSEIMTFPETLEQVRNLHRARNSR